MTNDHCSHQSLFPKAWTSFLTHLMLTGHQPRGNRGELTDPAFSVGFRSEETSKRERGREHCALWDTPRVLLLWH